MASSRDSVPANIFASDQHKLSVRYEEPKQDGNEPPALGLGSDLPVAPSDPEVIEIDEGPEAESDHLLDWRVPYLDCLI
jgi:hypothetical protein